MSRRCFFASCRTARQRIAERVRCRAAPCRAVPRRATPHQLGTTDAAPTMLPLAQLRRGSCFVRQRMPSQGLAHPLHTSPTQVCAPSDRGLIDRAGSLTRRRVACLLQGLVDHFLHHGLFGRAARAVHHLVHLLLVQRWQYLWQATNKLCPTGNSQRGRTRQSGTSE